MHLCGFAGSKYFHRTKVFMVSTLASSEVSCVIPVNKLKFMLDFMPDFCYHIVSHQNEKDRVID